MRIVAGRGRPEWATDGPHHIPATSQYRYLLPRWGGRPAEQEARLFSVGAGMMPNPLVPKCGPRAPCRFAAVGLILLAIVTSAQSQHPEHLAPTEVTAPRVRVQPPLQFE